MNQMIVIRNETDDDARVITEVTVAAFRTLAVSSHREQFIIEALRAADALTVSLLAELNGQVAGHIAFSPVTISDGSTTWFGLGPISVFPELQRQGIGKGLKSFKPLEQKGAVSSGIRSTTGSSDSLIRKGLSSRECRRRFFLRFRSTVPYLRAASRSMRHSRQRVEESRPDFSGIGSCFSVQCGAYPSACYFVTTSSLTFAVPFP